MHYPDGIYKGELVDGLKRGKGKYEYTDGTYHKGRFYNDKFLDGIGTVKYADGSLYKGEF